MTTPLRLPSFLPAPRAAVLLLIMGMLCIGCGEAAPAPEPLLRHGEPGVRPFWNSYAGRYIYPPAFDVADSTGQARAFQVTARYEGGTQTAALPHPWAALAPLWTGLPAGRVTLHIEGALPSGEPRVLRTVDIIKSPDFSAVPPAAIAQTDSAGLAGLEAVARLGNVRHWLDPGGPDPTYPLWVHPSKLMGVLSQGMLALAQHTPDAPLAAEARAVAHTVGRFLLTLREPPGTPLAGWTHSYWDGVDRGAHPIYMNQIMTLYPSEAAMAFLDLYDDTGEDAWWTAVRAIADTYQRTQRPDGTWPLLMRRETGAPVRDMLLVPVSVLTFLDRLAGQYGVEDYAGMRTAAFDWIMAHPVQTFAWNAQFEDTRPKAQYRNLSHREAAGFARLLFETTDDPEHHALARELLLFVEDQFVVWTPEDAVTRTDWFKPEAKWNGNVEGGGKDWFLPAVLEQYAFYTPTAGSTSNVIHAYCAGYAATGIASYQARAQALAQTLIAAQRHHGTGEIPTHLRKTLPEANWLNNSVYAARTLLEATCL